MEKHELDPAEVRLWYGHLLAATLRILKDLGIKKNDVLIHSEIFVEVVIRFLKDRQRLQFFHGIEQLSQENRAGYICHWFSRLKPIQVMGKGLAALNDVVSMLLGLSTATTSEKAEKHSRNRSGFLG